MTESELVAATWHVTEPAMPYLARWGPGGQHRCWPLQGESVTVGRASSNDLVLDDDPLVSRTHVVLERLGGSWSAEDNGLSRNGTFLNGRRLTGRSPLRDRDQLGVGRTLLTFCCPGQLRDDATLAGEPLMAMAKVTHAQRAVLVALCRPDADRHPYATPATNQDIADALVLSVDAVKSHLRALFHVFGIDHLPQNQKRVRLAEMAVQLGVVPRRGPELPGRSRHG